MSKKIDLKVRAIARVLFERDGLTCSEIGKRLNIKPNTIQHWRCRNGWKTPYEVASEHQNELDLKFYNLTESDIEQLVFDKETEERLKSEIVDISLECHLEDYFVDRVELSGGKAYKFTSPGCPGVPDRIVLFPGGHVGFVELKRPDGKGHLSDVQRKELDIMRLLGQKVFILDNYDRVDEIIDCIKDNKQFESYN